MTVEEKRSASRYEVTAYVDYSGQQMLHCHRVQNISVGGICIHTALLEDVGKQVNLVIHFPDLDQTFRGRGEVVWTNRKGIKDMGVRFVDLSSEQTEMLERYIDAVQAKRAV